MISYPVDTVNTRWAFVRESDGQKLNRKQKWPVLDGSEIPGLDPDIIPCLDIKWLPIAHPQYQAEPDYDSRSYSLQTIEEVDIPNNELKVQYNTIANSVDDRKIAADNEEMNQLSYHIPIERETLETRLMLAAVLNRVLNGTAFPTKLENLASNYIQTGIKIYKNRDNRDSIHVVIDNGEDPDYDKGWEPTE